MEYLYVWNRENGWKVLYFVDEGRKPLSEALAETESE